MNQKEMFADPFHLLGMLSAICDMPIPATQKVEMIKKAIKEFIDYHQKKEE